MRRAVIVVAFAALAAAGALAAGVLAGTPLRAFQTTSTTSTAPTTTTTTTTTTTSTTTTSTTTTTTTAPATTTTAPTTTTTQPARPRLRPTIASRVSVGGVRVGGLTPADAVAAVQAEFSRPLEVVVAGRTFRVEPAQLGAAAYVRTAVARARIAPPGSAVRLHVTVRGAQVRAFVDRLAKRVARPAVDSRLMLRDLRPYVTAGHAGRTLVRAKSARILVEALVRSRREGIELPVKVIPQKVSRKTFGPVVVIRRDSHRLFLYDGMRLRRTFGVAVGAAAYPTPLGRFQIVVMWRNPWWYPPASPWAQGLEPVPPGPGNPLGTRWMGINSPGVGIHGTPDAASIGYSLSHGCIRMRIPDAEWLFEHLDVGTPVFIVAA